MYLVVLPAGTTAATPPSAATDGVALSQGVNAGRPYEGFSMSTLEDVVCELWSTAGSGVMTAAVRLWGYSPEAAKWFPIGVTPAGGSDPNRGLLNNGVTIGEIATVADSLNFAQPIGCLKAFSRVAAEIVGALGGTSTAIKLILRGL